MSSISRQLGLAITLAVAAGACQDGDDGRGAPGGDAPAAAPALADAAAEEVGAAGPAPSAPTPSTTPGEPPEVLTFDQAVEQLGAIPAWRAVLERDRFLARRGDRGVVFGRVGGAAAPGQTWLVDETQGHGTLAIRVRFGGFAVEPGARVAVRGTWTVDDAEAVRRWVWAAERVTALPPGDGEAPEPAVDPGLVVHEAAPPGGAASVRSPDEVGKGEPLGFTVLGEPARPGDGWPFAAKKGGPLAGYVILPGEADIYGGHDLRSPDERWALKKGATYWVEVRRVRRRDGQPIIVEAATPPARLP